MRFAICPTRPACPLTWLLAAALSLTASCPGAWAAVDKPDTPRAAATRPSATVKSTPSAPSAQSAPSAPSARSIKAVKPKPPIRQAKAATPRQVLKSAASDLALASATAEAIDDAQLGIAARVLTGDAQCEFNQRITVLPDPDQPGYFRVAYKNQRYRMVPRETTTGAVRLEDPAAGIVWLQIPTKSMLMNTRIGQRLVDACTHAEQRVALAAVADAANALGILPTAAAVPVPAAAMPPAADLPNPSTEPIASVVAANAAAKAAAEAAAVALTAPQAPLVQPLPPVPPQAQQAPEAPTTALTEPPAGGRRPM